jgi:hypothetical protein
MVESMEELESGAGDIAPRRIGDGDRDVFRG